MKRFEVVLTRTIILAHATYDAENKKDAEKKAALHFSKIDLYDDETDMEITEVE